MQESQADGEKATAAALSDLRDELEAERCAALSSLRSELDAEAEEAKQNVSVTGLWRGGGFCAAYLLGVVGIAGTVVHGWRNCFFFFVLAS